jgi:hypothetical protein
MSKIHKSLLNKIELLPSLDATQDVVHNMISLNALVHSRVRHQRMSLNLIITFVGTLEQGYPLL